MNQQTVAWLVSLEKIRSELANVILPLSSRHAAQAPEIVQMAEMFNGEIEQYFKRFDVQITPLQTRKAQDANRDL